MSQTAAFTLLAQYNQWMNAKLIETIRPLSHEDIWADRGAFFGSVMGTLNHLIVADIIWLRRLSLHPAGGSLPEILADYPTPTALNSVLYERLDDYIPAREALDQLWIDFTGTLTLKALETPFSYRRVNGEAHHKALGLVLTHIFNHQTHHRGQITTLVSQMGLDIGATDFLVLVPDITDV